MAENSCNEFAACSYVILVNKYSDKIRNYLLGNLPASEEEEIERRYFADRQVVDEIWAVFGDIAEEYLDGDLSESESRRFEQRLRSSPTLREMFELESAMFDYAGRAAAGTSQPAETDDPISGLTRKRQWPPVTFINLARLAAAVASIIALVAFVTWFASRPREVAKPVAPEGAQQVAAPAPESPGKIAQPSSQPQRDADAKQTNRKTPSITTSSEQRKSATGTSLGTTATFFLSGERVREEQGALPLKIPARTETVQLELEVSKDHCAYYSAVLLSPSNESLQTWEKLPVQSDHSILKVVLRIRASSLSSADYAVRLNCLSRDKNSIQQPSAKNIVTFFIKPHIQ